MERFYACRNIAERKQQADMNPEIDYTYLNQEELHLTIQYIGILLEIWHTIQNLQLYILYNICMNFEKWPKTKMNGTISI